ncbi:fimbrial biogenesis chaperone [Ewingella americana]|jgi:fimbrial chaperone protein|uniref:Sigma-fimbriae chaperone protein n=2 Tax=Ewingella americana TaxID=41202 RepID=A0A085G6L2_EWIA3|nr:molecular chaperone [Ewingella americana]KAA8727641.1 molecular chaperone [Ewingella americana]KFC79357.1 sigma-fimbriae chaperone protein [Ewingella americana ATCC 33852]STQ42935.1 putative chaperone protein EcpD [Ewingella americana]
MYRTLLRALISLLSLSLFLVAAPGWAASSVLVWPVYQIIESDQNGSALWLENRGAAPVSLQVRVLAWKQENFNERYADQNDVVASPPFATVAPGQRQLIRLIRNTQVAPKTEKAFRIIIDEIPSPLQPSEQGKEKAVVGLQLQMRYLLPLFLDGEGIWTNERADIKRNLADATKPVLTWSIESGGGKSFLRIRNTGVVHARLSNVFWSMTGDAKRGVKAMTTGFMGYVLPGQEMRWPVPAGVIPGGQLNAQIADNAEPIVIPRGE